MKKFSEFIAEGNSLARTFTLKKKGLHSATVSPERKNKSAEENKIAAKQLEAHTRKAGYGFRKAEGEWDEGDGMGKEKSYQIIANKAGPRASTNFRRFIKKLGAKLNQQAVIHNDPKKGGSRSGGVGKEIVTTDHTSPGGEAKKVGQKTTYGRMHYNTPNPYGITRFKKGGSFTWK